MDNKLLVGLGVFLAFFLLFPVVMQQMKGTSPTASVSSEVNPANANGAPRMSDEPPFWNSANIVGTKWEVEYEGQAQLTISIAANGVCYVSHPLMRSVTGVDYVEGRWSLDYNIAYVNFRFGTRVYDFALTIRGDKIYEPRGVPIKRL